jgi:DNA primase
MFTGIIYDWDKFTYWVSEVDIINRYFNVNVPCVIRSPLRDDKHPSFSIHLYCGVVYWRDFATGENGNVPSLLMRKFNISYGEMMRMLNSERNTIIYVYQKGDINIKRNAKAREKQNISYRQREWRRYDLDYWYSYGIDPETLKKCDVKPISHILIGDKALTCEPRAYAYVEHKDGVETVKIYQPYSKRLKWLSSHDSSVWDLWVPAMNSNNETLIITSSRKDAMCLIANLDIPAVSMQGEGYIPKSHVMNQLKDKFDNIYIMYDNDYDKPVNTGRDKATAIADKYHLRMIEIPEEYESKDPSDLYRNKGREKFLEILVKLLNS